MADTQWQRLALTPSGQVRYALKTPHRDGTTHIVLEPLDLMARLAALVPPPRMHLTRYHGVFAPHSRLRAAITPAGRGPGGKTAQKGKEPSAKPRHVAMSWAQRLKRVFAIEIDTCVRWWIRRRDSDGARPDAAQGQGKANCARGHGVSAGCPAVRSAS